MSSGQYTYDTTGNSYFFVLTALLVFLIPFTWTTFYGGYDRAATRVPVPCEGWNAKSPSVKRGLGSRSAVTKRHVILAASWVLFAFVVERASKIQAEELTFDPFKILGVASGSTEQQIRKHYKKLARTFHPDKVQLAVNQTKQESDDHFVTLTKAYKSLTDDDTRRNLERFGHPDGKQDFSQGIALPSWVVESNNAWWVMGAYAAVLGLALPYLVSRWWKGSQKHTKDGTLNATAGNFFLAMKENCTFSELLELLASADEFRLDEDLVALRKEIGKPGVDEYARLTSSIREGVEGKDGWTGYANWEVGKKRARVLIAAHLLRIPIKSLALLREQHNTVALALPLTNTLLAITLSNNWLSTTIQVLHLQQFILQGVHPSSSPLRQLPHMNDERIKLANDAEVDDVPKFGRLRAAQVEKIMLDAGDEEKKAAFGVAKNWPVIRFVDTKFQVVGEKVVTPGSIVNFTVKLRMTPPGRAESTDEVVVNDQKNLGHIEAGAESTIDELIGRRKAGEDGVEPTPLAHAPEFTKNRKPTWYIFVGDHKLNRIFVAPEKFTDMGVNHVRTVRITFQAPPGPGLYTFQAHVMCDSYVGTDIQKDVRMTVNPPANGEELVGEEDEISEPDEDTIAGQMAIMKGNQVRKAGSDDDSSTAESDSEDTDSSDESD